jgi:hypothetical protein
LIILNYFLTEEKGKAKKGGSQTISGGHRVILF